MDCLKNINAKHLFFFVLFFLFVFFPWQNTKAFCGDTVIDPGEQCDQTNLNGSNCNTIGYSFGNLACNADCTYNMSACNSCGDGFIQWGYGEICDTGNLGGKTCTNLVPSQGFIGGTLSCNNANCSSFNTSGCYSQVCGNSIIETGEQCDSLNLGSPAAACNTQGFNRGNFSCSSCAFNTSQCFNCGDGIISAGLETCDQGGGNVANLDGCNSNCQIENGYGCAGTPSVCSLTCGNNQINSGEVCDGTALNSQSCATQGFTGGTLSCNANCSSFNTSGCYSQVCGNSIIETGEQCDNGAANNGVACTPNYGSSCAYCTSICTKATVPAPYCGDTIVTAPNEQCEGINFGTNTCLNIPGGFTGGALGCNAGCVLNTTSCWKCGDNNINPGETCDGTALNSKSCATQGFAGGTLSCNANCSSFNTSGCYSQVCGNSIIETGEQCDNLNLGSPANTCSTQGFNRGALSCSSCAFNTSQCFTCGDGVISAGLETCDQGGGNVANLNGCNSNCQIENGYGCTGAPSVCSLTCGNGNLNAGEICDPNHIPSKTTACADANLYNGSKNCLTDCSGYGTCNTTESCNDTIINGNELCDNNANPCAINGYRGTQNCTMTGPSSCRSFNACVPTERCGDNIVNGFETCDDGNSAGSDGCNNTCQTESGYTCNNSVSPSVCSYNCGNGSLEPVETCDPNHVPTATATCVTNNNYPGTKSCLNTCTGYGACATTLRCGDNTFTNPPETCDGDTRGCLTIVGLYNGTQTCMTTCNSYGACASTEYCGDHIMNGTEECDFDPNSNNQNIGLPRNGDGCSTDCKAEEGFVCSGTNPTTCVFSCGNEVLQLSAPFNEECDDGAVEKLRLDNQPTTAPYNGDICVAANYGATCTWCDRACNNQTTYGDYCGDGVWNEGFEECDDGNFNSYDGCTSCEDGGDISDGNAGCTQGCKEETGFVCSGIFSSCKTECGDGYCAVGPESCLTCINDCGLCPIGRRPGVSAAHDKGVFTSLFEKIKIFLIQPQPLIQIPGMNLGEEKLNQEFIPPPPPISKNYEVGKPTMVKIGNEYFTITVQTINSGNNSVSFTVK